MKCITQDSTTTCIITSPRTFLEVDRCAADAAHGPGQGATAHQIFRAMPLSQRSFFIISFPSGVMGFGLRVYGFATGYDGNNRLTARRPSVIRHSGCALPPRRTNRNSALRAREASASSSPCREAENIFPLVTVIMPGPIVGMHPCEDEVSNAVSPFLDALLR